MKILFVYQYCILGGVTTQLVNRLEGLKKDWDVHFLFLGDYGGRTVFKEYSKVYIFNNQKQFKELVEAQKYDIISIIDTNQVYSWLKQCDYKGLVVNEVHTTTQNLEKINALKSEKIIDVIVTPSVYMKNVIENTYGFKGSVPVEVVSNCIDTRNFIPVASKKQIKKPIILWIGKLDDHKKWHDFIKIARKLEYEYKAQDFHYVVVGGVTAPQEVVDRFMDSLVQNQLIHKVSWYSAVGYEDMRRIYVDAYESGGVYVSTTSNESFGMTVLEAMCMKIPIVVPKVGALVELCAPYGDNILYTPGNLNQACDFIMKQIGTQINYNTAIYSAEHVCETFKQTLTKYVNQLKGKRR